MLTPLDRLLAACKYVTYFIVTGVMYSQKCAINTSVQVGHLALTSEPSPYPAHSDEGGNWQTFLVPNYPRCHCEIRFLTQPLMHASISTYIPPNPIDFHAWCLATAAWMEAAYEKGVRGILIHLWDETRHEYAKVELSQQSEWYPPHHCRMSWVGDNWLPYWGIGELSTCCLPMSF